MGKHVQKSVSIIAWNKGWQTAAQGLDLAHHLFLYGPRGMGFYIFLMAGFKKIRRRIILTWRSSMKFRDQWIEFDWNMPTVICLQVIGLMRQWQNGVAIRETGGGVLQSLKYFPQA